MLDDQAIDHRDMAEAGERTDGKPLDLAIQTPYNRKTKTFDAFCTGYRARVSHYRRDL